MTSTGGAPFAAAGRRPGDDALPPVSIGVVTHDREDRLRETIDCLRALSYPRVEVLFADNASRDGTVELIRASLPRARVIRLAENRGPNPARNLLLQRASHRLVLLVDDDVLFGPDALQPLVRRMTGDPRCGLVMPRVVFHRDPGVVQYGDIWPHFLGEVAIRNAGRRAAELPNREIRTPLTPGLFLLVDRDKAREIGGFDEFYVFGKTDSDFAFRMTLAGYDNVEVPASVVRHDARPRGLSAAYLQTRNRWYWIAKLFSTRTLLAILPALLVHEAVTAGFLTARGRGRDYARAVGAFLASLGRTRAARREVMRLKRVRDRDVLTGRGIEVRSDVVPDRSLARRLLEAYDRAMGAYWSLVRRLL